MSSFPETDAETYRMWVDEGWHTFVLKQLELLLKFVRELPINGLDTKGIRKACLVPFGGPDLYNRKVALYMDEIEAYNGKHTPNDFVNERSLEHGWQLAGLPRP